MSPIVRHVIPIGPGVMVINAIPANANAAKVRSFVANSVRIADVIDTV